MQRVTQDGLVTMISQRLRIPLYPCRLQTSTTYVPYFRPIDQHLIMKLLSK